MKTNTASGPPIHFSTNLFHEHQRPDPPRRACGRADPTRARIHPRLHRGGKRRRAAGRRDFPNRRRSVGVFRRPTACAAGPCDLSPGLHAAGGTRAVASVGRGARSRCRAADGQCLCPAGRGGGRAHAGCAPRLRPADRRRARDGKRRDSLRRRRGHRVPHEAHRL